MIRRGLIWNNFPLLRLNRYYFSLKKQQRLNKKLEEEKQYESIQTLDSVVDQNDYTQEQLKQFIQQKIDHTREVANETSIPSKALVAIALVSLPMIILPSSLFWMIQSSSYLHIAPTLYTAAFKYSAISISFSAGIHWGVAMSLHEQQLDSLNSSKEARKQFILATIPMIFSIVLLNQISLDSSLMITALQSLGFMSLYTCILDYLAIYNQQLPKWWLQIKLFYLITYLTGLGGLWFLWLHHQELLQQKESYYRRTIFSPDQILKNQLK